MERHIRIALSVTLILTMAACAKPPTAKITAARDAVTAIEANADVAAFSEEARLAARTALDAMEAELQVQAGKGPLARRYQQLESLAAEVVRLGERAASEAKAAREYADWAAAELARITAAIDEIRRTGSERNGESDVGLVRGGSLEYLACLEQSGSIALFDGGYPDTGVGEGFVPDEKALLYQFLVAMELSETIKGSRDEVIQQLVTQGYKTDQGSLDFPNPVRFASRARQGTDSDVDAIGIYLLDDRTGVGIEVCSLGVPVGAAGLIGSVTPTLPYSVTPNGKAAVVITRRFPTNEYDPGEDTAVVVGWDCLSRFAQAVAMAAYREAASRAAAGEVPGALEHLHDLKGILYPVAEELLVRVRSDTHFDRIRSSQAYVDFLRNAFPTVSRHGLEELFEEYACEVVQTRLAVALDEKALAAYGDNRKRIVEGVGRGTNYASQYAVVTWPCGTACESGVLVDLTDGSIFDLPQSRGGFEHRGGSLLLVADAPYAFDDSRFTQRDSYPVYYAWRDSKLELLADTRVVPVRGK